MGQEIKKVGKKNLLAPRTNISAKSEILTHVARLTLITLLRWPDRRYTCVGLASEILLSLPHHNTSASMEMGHFIIN